MSDPEGTDRSESRAALSEAEAVVVNAWATARALVAADIADHQGSRGVQLTQEDPVTHRTLIAWVSRLKDDWLMVAPFVDHLPDQVGPFREAALRVIGTLNFTPSLAKLGIDYDDGEIRCSITFPCVYPLDASLLDRMHQQIARVIASYEEQVAEWRQLILERMFEDAASANGPAARLN